MVRTFLVFVQCNCLVVIIATESNSSLILFLLYWLPVCFAKACLLASTKKIVCTYVMVLCFLSIAVFARYRWWWWCRKEAGSLCNCASHCRHASSNGQRWLERCDFFARKLCVNFPRLLHTTKLFVSCVCASRGFFFFCFWLAFASSSSSIISSHDWWHL